MYLYVPFIWYDVAIFTLKKYFHVLQKFTFIREIKKKSEIYINEPQSYSTLLNRKQDVIQERLSYTLQMQIMASF